MSSAGIVEARQVKRRIEEVKLSDVTEHMKKATDSAPKRSDERAKKMMQNEISSASRDRSDERMGKLMQAFQKNTMDRMELVMRQTNEMMLLSVNGQLHGTNMREEGEDRYIKMNEKITTMETRLARLEDPDRQSVVNMNVDEFHRSQDDQNKRSGSSRIHDDTTEQKAEDIRKESIVETGMSMEKSRSYVLPSRSHMYSYTSQTGTRDKSIKSVLLKKNEEGGK